MFKYYLLGGQTIDRIDIFDSENKVRLWLRLFGPSPSLIKQTDIMKTIHINLKVKELEKSISFYNELFGTKPTTVKSDYAKWQLDDPQVNFSLSKSADQAGLNHLGIQVDSSEELHKVYDNIERSKGKVMEEGHTVCCYSQSEKSWVEDPQGILWEAFHSYGTSEVNKVAVAAEDEGNCCAPNCCAS